MVGTVCDLPARRSAPCLPQRNENPWLGPFATLAASSSAETRKAAAEQIASIAAAHPGQLPAVVAAVSGHLRHNEWDARVAAGHCLGLLAEHFTHHTAADLEAAAAAGAPDGGEPGVKAEEGAAGAGGAGPADTSSHLLSFGSFSVKQVLEQGTPMLASGGEVRP